MRNADKPAPQSRRRRGRKTDGLPRMPELIRHSIGARNQPSPDNRRKERRAMSGQQQQRIIHGVQRAERIQETERTAIFASLDTDEDGLIDLSELREHVLARLEIVCRQDRDAEGEA